MKNQLCTPDFTIVYNVSFKFRGTNYIYFVIDHLEDKYGTCLVIKLFRTVMNCCKICNVYSPMNIIALIRHTFH